MKILHLISSGGLFGAERVILNLATQLKEGTSTVGALHNRHNPHLEIIQAAERLELKTTVFDSQGQCDVKTVLQIKKFLTENQVDILHTHNYKSDILGFLAARLAGKRWVATNHVWHGTDAKMRFYERLDAIVLKFTDKVIAVSEEIKDGLIKRGFRPERVQVIPNGIDIVPFQEKFQKLELRRSLGIQPHETVVVIVGRLAKEKGHGVFLDAAASIIRERKDSKFLIVGDGPLRQELTKRVSEMELTDSVIFAGIRQDMPAVYAMSDIMVNSSFIEGMPMTILEAMASQIPVVATAVGGVPQIVIDGQTGLLVPPGDAGALAERILFLINNPNHARSLAIKAREFVQSNYSLEKMTSKYRMVYKAMVN